MKNTQPLFEIPVFTIDRELELLCISPIIRNSFETRRKYEQLSETVTIVDSWRINFISAEL